jgi:MoaA/NifB/PqqE/SkfB family radical SAM enzyme
MQLTGIAKPKKDVIAKHISKYGLSWQRRLKIKGHQLSQIPIIILMPHSACNCKCVMCDIWKANRRKQEISPDVLSRHLDSLAELGVRWVVLSGGEALLHSNLWQLCRLLKSLRVKITLLSTGLTLAEHAAEIVRWCDEVIVSIDGTEKIHNEIRRIPQAYRRLQDGIATLRQHQAGYRITGRCVIQRRNYFALPEIITAARRLRLDRPSTRFPRHLTVMNPRRPVRFMTFLSMRGNSKILRISSQAP